MKIKDRAKPVIPPVDAGTYFATLVQSIDIGEQKQEFKDKGVKYNNLVSLGFELAGETITIDVEEKPRMLSRKFTMSSGKNAGLRKFFEAYWGKAASDDAFREFDPNDAVGTACMVTVVHSEDGQYANISAMSQLVKGAVAPVAISPLIRYDMEPWDQVAFDALPEWAQETIKKSSQYIAMHVPTEELKLPEVVGDAVESNDAVGGAPF